MSAPRKLFLIAALAGLTACAQQTETPVGIQPTFDKFGNAYCPTGYVLAGDVCLLPEDAQALGVGGGGTNPPGGTTPGGTTPGNQNQNQNQNNNANQGQNQNQNNNANQGQNQQGNP